MFKKNMAHTAHPIHDLIANRWSPVCLDNDTPVEKEKVDSILEAARWAPSSYNAQPWSYIVGFKGDPKHTQLAACIVEGNAWAKEAPVLMLAVANKVFPHNGKENRHYLHDVGAASVLMAIQATDLGLSLRQMAGFDLDQARTTFSIPDTHEPGSMMAIGYCASDSSTCPQPLQDRDAAPRQRKDFTEMTYGA